MARDRDLRRPLYCPSHDEQKTGERAPPNCHAHVALDWTGASDSHDSRWTRLLDVKDKKVIRRVQRPENSFKPPRNLSKLVLPAAAAA
jgi:hypothetical protein